MNHQVKNHSKITARENMKPKVRELQTYGGKKVVQNPKSKQVPYPTRKIIMKSQIRYTNKIRQI